jgi:hypothetical protein
LSSSDVRINNRTIEKTTGIIHQNDPRRNGNPIVEMIIPK